MKKQKITIIRGLPGSGKSTMASKIIGTHLETDMYFIDNCGKYSFDPKEIKYAHQWCQLCCRKELVNGNSVIVSNTFCQKWEMEPYFQMAKEFECYIEVIVCKEQFGSIHGVPSWKIEQMKQRWED